MSALQREMNRMFEDFFSGSLMSSLGEPKAELRGFAPKTDVSETDREIKVTAELPGMEEKDISVTLEDDYLLLEGERKEEKKEEDERYYHQEMAYGSFRRMIPLDVPIDRDKVEAKFNNGVLRVTLPKLPAEEGARGRRIKIGS
jgi:HSP20 family protein